MKRFLAMIFVLCICFSVCAPLCAFAEGTSESAQTSATSFSEEATAEGDSDIVAVSPTQSNGLKNVLIVCAMGGLVILVALVYIFRAKKQLSSSKEE